MLNKTHKNSLAIVDREYFFTETSTLSTLQKIDIYL